MTFKTFITKFSITATMVGVLIGTAPSVFAQSTPGDISGKRLEFCQRIDSIGANIENRIQNRTAVLGDRYSTIKSNIIKRGAERLDNLEQNRDQHDQKRTERYNQLSTRANTDAEKTAVQNFQANIESAVTTRRTAVDNAISVFRSGVQDLNSAKVAEANSAVTNFQSSVDSAIAKAKASCTAGTDPATIRTQLSNDIKSAKDTLRQSRESIRKSTAIQLESLRTTRRSSIETAHTAFRTTLSSEVAKLKQVFHGQDSK